MEKNVKPMSGLIGFLVILVVLGVSGYLFSQLDETLSTWKIAAAVLLAITGFFLMNGLVIVQPNHSRVLNFFGKYAGTVKENGWFFVNPFFTK